MKKSTVKNLVIGTVAFIGIGYVVENYIKNKKIESDYSLSKKRSELEELEKLNSEARNYITIAEVDLKSNKKIKKVI